MKYPDEYSYGIYSYIPDHGEREEERPAFIHKGVPGFRPDDGNPDINRFQGDYPDMSARTLPAESVFEPSANGERPAQELPEIRGEGEDDGNRFRQESKQSDPGKEKRTRQSGHNRGADAMPADPYPYNYPQNMNLALDMIRETLKGENSHKVFYSQLLSAASAQEDRDIIAGIRNDEMKHFELFRKLYYEHTGKKIKAPEAYGKETRTTYCEGLKKALAKEMKAVEKCRKILFAMQDRRDINIMTEILTDELRHADFLILLFSLNACRFY